MSAVFTILPLGCLQDEIEADRGGLRVSEEVLRAADGGEPAAAEGGGGASGVETLASVLHADAATHHAHHVPLLRAGGGTALLCSRSAVSRPSAAPPRQPMGGCPGYDPPLRGSPPPIITKQADHPYPAWVPPE